MLPLFSSNDVSICFSITQITHSANPVILGGFVEILESPAANAVSAMERKSSEFFELWTKLDAGLQSVQRV